MYTSAGTGRRTTVLRFGLLLPAVFLSACQLVTPPRSAPGPRLLGDQSNVSVAGAVAAAPAAPQNTYTVKRDTLRDSLALTGRVVPNQVAQLSFKGTGTVVALNVTSGQQVEESQTLAEFALDAESLQAARAQATLADLAY